jgi:hypothetical protein
MYLQEWSSRTRHPPLESDVLLPPRTGNLLVASRGAPINGCLLDPHHGLYYDISSSYFDDEMSSSHFLIVDLGQLSRFSTSL